MKKKILFALLYTSFIGFSQNNPKNYNYYIKNPQIIAEHKMPARSAFSSYPNMTSIDAKANPNQLILDGIWKFKWVKSPKNRPLSFVHSNFDVSDWNNINVPSNWEVEGFGTPIYVNHQYEFSDYKAPISKDMKFVDKIYPANPGNVPDDYNPVGSYRRDFTLSDNWTTDQKVFLHIGAMKSGGFVWINGTYVGYSQGSKLPAEFDISNFIKRGENTIAIQVFRWTDGSYLECQDFWRISGIERGVYLYKQPKARVEDVSVMATLDDSYKNGKLNIDTYFDAASKSMKLAYTLIDKTGQEITSGVQPLTNVNQLTISKQLSNVQPWSAEHPYLYTLILKTLDKKEKVLEVIPFKVGFRTVEIKNGILKLNGQHITLKGVNTQEADPETGHVMSEELVLKDIKMWKENNINAVRLSHYPRADRFYELCDLYGIYVVDEANIESHGMYYGKYSLAKNTSWEKAHTARMTNMVDRHKNYASVIIWSMGNEAGNGVNFYAGYKAIKKHDPIKRPVQYERSYKETDGNLLDMDWNTDIIVPQYPSPALFERIGEVKTNRPFIPSEYAHAMGNSTGNFQDYWDIIEQHDNLQGGFIWDWVDQSIWRTNKKGEKFYAYGGDYGKNTPTDNTFLNNGIVFPDRTPQPALYEVKKAHEFINLKQKGYTKKNELRVLVENLYDFTNLNKFTINTVVWSEDDKVVKTINPITVNSEPHTGDIIRIPLSDVKMEANKEYFLNFSVTLKEQWGVLPAGFEVAKEQIQIRNTTKKEAKATDNNIASLSANKKHIIAKGEDVKIKISKSSGQMISYKVNGEELIKDGHGLLPNFWRAPTDNDLGNKMHIRNIEWKKASMPQKATSVNVVKDHRDNVVKVSYNLPSVKTTYTITYKIFEDGQILVKATMLPSSVKSDIPRIGLRMQIPKTYNNLTYFGRGPWENYQDRKASAFVGVYNSTIKNQYVPYIRPQENGYKTDTRWIVLKNNNGKGIKIKAINNHVSFSALHIPNEDLDITATTNYKDAKDLNYSKHTTDIIQKNLIQLNIDFAQRGVAGDNSWSAKPQPKYQLNPSKSYTYQFIIIPLK